MRLLCLLAALLALCLSGCGGGKRSETGRATLTVRWPEPSRLVPVASNSILVSVTRAGQGLGTALLVRPSGGGIVNATVDRLPVGAATVTATALPNADGTGVPQASASVGVNIVANQTAHVRLTMASTIASLSVTPAAPQMTVGQSAVLSVTARNAIGEVVLISPATLTFVSDAPGRVIVDPAGILRAFGAGAAGVTVTETESGKKVVASVSVAPASGTPGGPPLFGSPTFYSVSEAGPVRVADMDGDGKVDVVVTSRDDLMILYGRGDGTLEPPLTVAHVTGGLMLMDVADLDGDRRRDVICINMLLDIQPVVNPPLRLFFNQGGRRFRMSLETSGFGTVAAVANLNGDAAPDIVLKFDSNILLLNNRGDGTVTSGGSFNAPYVAESFLPVDVDRDGRQDIVVSYGDEEREIGGVRVFLGAADGFHDAGAKEWPTFRFSTTPISPTPAVADFDHDGKLDVVQGVYRDGLVVVYRGKGDGTLYDGVAYPAPNQPTDLRALDMNGDGWADIFLGNRGDTHASLLLNRGDGTFADVVPVESGGDNIRFVAVADLNGDGKPELILSGQRSGTVSVLMNRTP